MSDNTDSISPVIRIDQPGDCLALVQSIFGFRPRESVVLMGLRAEGTGGHLRADLAPALIQPRQASLKFVDWIAGKDSAPIPEAVMAMIFSDQLADAETSARLTDFLSYLSAHLWEQAQIPLVHVWQVDQVMIHAYGCEEGACCPPEGYRLDAVLTEAARRLPQLFDSLTAADAHQIVGETLRASTLDSQQLAEIAQAWESAPLPVSEEAALILWDAAISSARGSEGQVDALVSPHHAALLLKCFDLPWSSTALPVLAAADVESALDSEPQVLLASTDVVPDWSRIEGLAALLESLLPVLDAAPRIRALLVMSWIEWSRGRGSTADALLDVAAEISPHDVEISVLRSLVAQVCPWARVKQLSYSWWKNSPEKLEDFGND